MGVPGYMIASTLLAVLAQRLVRVNCRYCSETYSPQPVEIAWVNHVLEDVKDKIEPKFQRGRGCSRCNDVGYYGRVGIFEMIEMTAPLATSLQSSDPRQFETVARAQLGNNTMVRQVLNLVLAGETTVDEAMQVVTSL